MAAAAAISCCFPGFVCETSLPLQGHLTSRRVYNDQSRVSTQFTQILGGFKSCKLSGSRVYKRYPPRYLAGVARCEQVTDGGSNGLDIWLGRAAMIGFVATIAVEIVTGNGLLENAGIGTPVPTLALAIAAVVGVITAIRIFLSTSND